jgi:hypothetical protein
VDAPWTLDRRPAVGNIRRKQLLSRKNEESPLTDSNRRPLPYHRPRPRLRASATRTKPPAPGRRPEWARRAAVLGRSDWGRKRLWQRVSCRCRCGRPRDYRRRPSLMAPSVGGAAVQARGDAPAAGGCEVPLGRTCSWMADREFGATRARRRGDVSGRLHWPLPSPRPRGCAASDLACRSAGWIIWRVEAVCVCVASLRGVAPSRWNVARVARSCVRASTRVGVCGASVRTTCAAVRWG